MMDESLPLTVKDLLIAPGEAAGRVVGTGASDRVTIHVELLKSSAWDGVISALAADPALVAAILDGELPATLTAAARPCTLEPSTREVRSECTCRRRAESCPHVGAVWGAVQDELRRQPALVLTLRGRDPASLASDACGLAALAARDQDAGMDAAAAYERTARSLPRPPEVQAPAAVSRPDSWVEQDVLPHQRLLDQAADAASRALEILRGTGDGCLELDRQTDVARIGSSLASPWDVSNLAWRAGMSPVELGRMIRAWQAGGSREGTVVERSPVPTIVTVPTSASGPANEQLSPVTLKQLELFDR
jgi:uncharacterized Zn finger protein